MLKRQLPGLFIFFLAGASTATEEPKYTVIEQSGDLELRAYDPMVIAETLVSGSIDDASGTGFRMIADFIFGNNTARASGNEKISMTAPVSMEKTERK